MKKTLLISLLTIFVSVNSTFAKPVKPDKAQKAANTFLKSEKLREQKKLTKVISKQVQKETNLKNLTVGEIKEVRSDDGKMLAYVTEFEPEGYIITSADDKIRPVIGYSFKGKFSLEDFKQNVLLHLVQWDMEARLKALNSGTPEVEVLAQSNTNSWEMFASDNDEFVRTTESTTTQWDPLITTQWDQDDPYNKFCPKDYLYPLNPGNRCDVGCTATAAAQIINYWAYPTIVSFSNLPWWLGGDEYDSKKMSSCEEEWVKIDIDGDSGNYDFPSFSELNSALSNINYAGDTNEIALLCFAAGIKHRMDYSACGSGANLSGFAYKVGFDYGSASCPWWRLNPWSSCRDEVIDNIKKGWPVQIGVSRPTESKRRGHSVIIDGYKSTGEFHVNCGWLGGGDFWYDLPDLDTTNHGGSYDYDRIDSIVYNICPYQGWSQWGADAKNSFSTIYVAPTTDPPINKWYHTCSSGYSFKGLVVGTGNRIYASSVPDTQGNHPSIWVINQYGEKEKKLLLTRKLTA